MQRPPLDLALMALATVLVTMTAMLGSGDPALALSSAPLLA